MEALVLGAGAESLHAIDAAHENGCRVVALDGSPDAPGLARADESFVVDICDEDAVLSCLRVWSPDFILPVPIGRALVSTGTFNDRWDLPGVRRSEAELCTDKYLFARFLQAKGLRGAKCFLAHDVKSDPTLLGGMASPFIVKPRFGSGSRGVCLLGSPKEVLEKLTDGDIVEEAFDGREYGLDGIVANGVLTILELRSKVNTPPPYRQCVGYQTVPLADKAYSSIGPFMQSVVQAIGIDAGLIHADIMVNGDSVFVIELSARPAGHSIYSDLIPLATGIDPTRLFIECCVKGRDVAYKREVRPLFMGFFNFGKCRIASCPDDESIVKEFSLIRYARNFRQGDIMSDSVDGSVTTKGFFVFEGEGRKAEMKAERILGSFGIERFL